LTGGPLLLADQLGRAFQGVVAVDDVSLEVNAGEIVGILGANGAGKTTTLRMLAGILEPHRGRALIDGVDMQQEPLIAKAKLGFLSGDTQLYPRLSPLEVLDYFGRLYGMSSERIRSRTKALVVDLAMEEFASRPCNTLSAGQRQRANVARAFLHEPPLLILDEPTNALDVLSGRFIIEALRKARDAGHGVLFSTHIMSEAEYLCDRIYLVHKGRVVAKGTVAELLAKVGAKNLTDAFFAFVEGAA
jgi:sodium transport system ATP-binding protein